ncbi:MAG: T9SS type A sorting domain-containing protein, partial [Chitinophagales bacterium]
DTLPSCDDCANEAYLYPQNGLAFDFDKNNVLSVSEKNINGITTRTLLSIDVTTGSIIEELPLNNNYRNLMYMQVNTDVVFPGDANHDGVVDMKDALAIGLRHGLTTNARTNPVIGWVGQVATNINNPFITNTDAKHTDANGDGQINVLDTTSILNNYKSVHNAGTSLPINNGTCDIPVYFSLIANDIYEDKIELEIAVGNDNVMANDIYGIAFTIVYDTTYITANSVSTQGVDSWFGFYEQDHFKLARDNYDNRELAMAVVGIDHQGRSGSGGIIKSIWGIEDEVWPIAQPVDVDFSIKDVYLIGYDESVQEVCDMDTTFTITRKTVGVKDVDNTFFNIYPQPSRDVIKIDCENEVISATIISLSGAILKEYHNVDKEIKLDDLSTGIYLLKVATANSVGVQKLLIK